MRDVYVAGVGMTHFGKFPDRTTRALAEEATNEALRDAGLAAEQVEMTFFANAVEGLLTGQEMIRGQVALRGTGLLGAPIVNVENACASASSAFHLAWMAVASGAMDIVIAVGAEKLSHPEKERAFAAIGTAIDLATRDELSARFSISPDRPNSLFMDVYAHLARDYMERTGATRTDLARVAAKNHGHGALNPKAQYRGGATVDDVLASREVASPLTLLMCSPIGDGAAAVVLCSAQAARWVEVPVRVRASVLVSGLDQPGAEGGAVPRAARRAYDMAGVGPEDLDVVELHDAAAPAELMLYEQLGISSPGEGAKLVAAGDTTFGGRIPVNPSGGLLAKGHPIGATGCAQIVELTEQLRGRSGARQVDGALLGLAENAGGFLGDDWAAAAVTILSV